MALAVDRHTNRFALLLDQLQQHPMSQASSEAPGGPAKRQRTAAAIADGAADCEGQKLCRALSLAGDHFREQLGGVAAWPATCLPTLGVATGRLLAVPHDNAIADALTLFASNAGLAAECAARSTDGAPADLRAALLAAAAHLPRAAPQHMAAQQGLLSAVALASAGAAAAAPATLPLFGLHPPPDGSGSGSGSHGLPSCSAEGSGEAPGPQPCEPDGAGAGQGRGGRRQCRTDQERQTATKEKNRRAQQRFRRAGRAGTVQAGVPLLLRCPRCVAWQPSSRSGFRAPLRGFPGRWSAAGLVPPLLRPSPAAHRWLAMPFPTSPNHSPPTLTHTVQAAAEREVRVDGRGAAAPAGAVRRTRPRPRPARPGAARRPG